MSPDYRRTLTNLPYFGSVGNPNPSGPDNSREGALGSIEYLSPVISDLVSSIRIRQLLSVSFYP
jgi:hypothetical protein